MEAPTVPAVTRESRVVLDDLVVHREPGREPLLGSQRVRRFLEVDDVTLRAVELVRETRTVGEAEDRLATEVGEEVDVQGLVRLLVDRGFVLSVDGGPVAGPKTSSVPKLLAGVSPGSLLWTRSYATGGVVAALFGAWLGAAFAAPSILPRPGDLWLSSNLALTLLGGFTALLAAAYVHELAHWAVARSHGVEAGIRASHRFYLLVLETDVTNAWLLPRAAQLQIFLAGMILNVGLVCAFGLLGLAASLGAVPGGDAAVAAFRFLAYVNAFPLVFQLFFFARTDLYYVLMVLLGERNLLFDARAALVATLARWTARVRLALARRPQPATVGAPRLRLVVLGAVFVLGQGLGYGYFLIVGGPFLLRSLGIAVAALAEGVREPDFVQILVGEWLLILTLAQGAFLGWLVLGPVVRRVRARRARAAAARFM